MLDLLTPLEPEKRPLSVMLARDPEVLTTMLAFYAWPEARVLDVTANERRMWKGVTHPGGVTYADIDPAMNPDIVADFRALPCEPASYDVIVFDPPHLPAASASPESMQRFVGNYGLGHAPKGDNISPYFGPFLREANRVLKPEGLIFAKLKDFVHNHAYQWMLAEFVMAAKKPQSWYDQIAELYRQGNNPYRISKIIGAADSKSVAAFVKRLQAMEALSLLQSPQESGAHHE